MLPTPILIKYGNTVLPTINGTYTNISPTTPNMNLYSQSICTSDSNTAYIFGGYNGSSSVNTFYRYNALSDTYTTLSNTSITARFGAGMTYYNGFIYIFGGTSSAGNVTEFYSYNVQTLQYTTITSTNTPSARSHNRMCTVGSKIYMYGGESSNNLFSYDPSTNAWTALANCPVTNNINGDMSTDGVYLYVVSSTNIFYRYDIAAGAWTTLAPRPSSTAYRTCYINGHIYAYGSKILQVYDIASNIWNTLPSGGYSVSRNGMVGLSNYVYSFGGVGATSTSSVWKIS